MIVVSIVGLIKKISYKNDSILSKTGQKFWRKYLSNDAKKPDVKNITHVDTWSFPLKTNLASLKTEINKLDINKLAPVTVDLNKLSDVD